MDASKPTHKTILAFLHQYYHCKLILSYTFLLIADQSLNLLPFCPKMNAMYAGHSQTWHPCLLNGHFCFNPFIGMVSKEKNEEYLIFTWDLLTDCIRLVPDWYLKQPMAARRRGIKYNKVNINVKIVNTYSSFTRG